MIKLNRQPEKTPLYMTVTAIFTALVCIATIIFSVYVPATEGFFNIGESMVFLSALLFGPYVGAFAGGVGSMLADLLLGYPHYAPATLVIKACEGFIVGMLSKKNPKLSSKPYWNFFTLVLGVMVGLLLGGIGATYYSGDVTITLGAQTIQLFIPSMFWASLGVAVAIFTSAFGFLADPEFGWMVFSVISGGCIMVLGYFLYQMFLLYPLFQIESVAIAEVPINIGQMIIGATIALPTTKIVLRMLPHLKKS
jgi:uncharacterized membrane protein